MDESVKLLVSIFGTLATVLLGLIAKGILTISNKQGDHNTQIALLKQEVSGAIKRIDSLHTWRNSLHEDEIDSYKELIKKLKKEIEDNENV